MINYVNTYYARVNPTATCQHCKKENTLEIDDIDFNFKGNSDETFICKNCKYTTWVKIRYGKICKVQLLPYEND